MTKQQAIKELLLNIDRQLTNKMDVRREDLMLIESVLTVAIPFINEQKTKMYQNVIDNLYTFLGNCITFNFLVNESDKDYVYELRELAKPYSLAHI